MKRPVPTIAALIGFFAATLPLQAHENYRTVGVISNRYIDKNKSTFIEVTQSDGDGVIPIQIDEKTAVTRDNNKVSQDELQKGRYVVIDSYGDDPEYSEALAIKIVPPIPEAR